MLGKTIPAENCSPVLVIALTFPYFGLQCVLGASFSWQRRLFLMPHAVHRRARTQTCSCAWLTEMFVVGLFCVYSPRHPIICLRWGVQTMRARGVAPDEITYSSAIAACGNSGEAKRAIELLQVRGAGAPRQAALIFVLLPVLCWTVAQAPQFSRYPFAFLSFRNSVFLAFLPLF